MGGDCEVPFSLGSRQSRLGEVKTQLGLAVLPSFVRKAARSSPALCALTLK